MGVFDSWFEKSARGVAQRSSRRSAMAKLGKVLVGYPAGTPAPTRGLSHQSQTRALRCDAGGAYLVIGGTSGLGFATARWMVARMARFM